MTECSANSILAPSHFLAPRQLNAQVNQIESGQSLPIVSSRPLRLGLDISSACNINCIFCLAKAKRQGKNSPDAFRSPEWIEHFDPVLPFVQNVIFSSYEAIMNPWFDQFVKYLRRYHTPFQLFSNGLGLVPEIGEFILRNGLQSLWCSVHAATEKTYANIMKGSDYDRVVRNLLHMKHFSRKNGIPWSLTLVFCAMRRNIEELPLYVDLARRLGADCIQVNYLLVTSEDTGLDGEAMFFHQDLYDYAVSVSKLKAAKFGIRLNHQPLFSEPEKQAMTRCLRPWEHLNVSKDGEVQICCGGSPSLGNMFAQGFARVWNSRKMVEFRARVNTDNPPQACRACTRGREDPRDVMVHLTWLRKIKGEERAARIAQVLAEHGGGRRAQAKIEEGLLTA